jgi:hypothetical protein
VYEAGVHVFIYGHTRIEQSGQNIDVCLRPLIDELTQLWSFGALTYDISRKHNFVMGATLMKTSMSILHGKQQGIHANKRR